MTSQQIAVNFLMPSLALALIVLIYLGHRTTSPILAIFSRWVRWLLISYIAAGLMHIAGWPDRPFWVLYTMSFLSWFLLETIYNWLAIDALSKSNYSLFPRFRENTHGDEWPNLEPFLDLKEELRTHKFTREIALIADIEKDFDIRSSIYLSADKLIRLQIIFFPHHTGRVVVTLGLNSLKADGTRLITDNIFLPYGGFYPENWYIERRTWMRKFTDLLHRHRERMDAFTQRDNKPFVPLDSDPLDFINKTQRQLERLNTEYGFLTPAEDHEENGRISWEGRFRVWKELWLLSYLGITGR